MHYADVINSMWMKLEMLRLEAEILSMNAYKLLLNAERNNDISMKMHEWIKNKD